MFQKNIKIENLFVIVSGLVFYFFNAEIILSANEVNQDKILNQEHTYNSDSWHTAVNKQEKKDDRYPEKRKITPETVRLTLNEYYVPQISELLEKGIDYFEWVNKLDDPYLNRYKVDLRIDPADERMKLFWKRKF